MTLRRLVAMPLLFICLLAARDILAQYPPPQPAPGLFLPSASIPYAFEQFKGKPQLVPIHHSSLDINNHLLSNTVNSLAFVKPKSTTEVPGVHARSIIHDPSASFYVFNPRDPDGSDAADDAKGVGSTWLLIVAKVEKDHRIFSRTSVNQFTAKASRSDNVLPVRVETLPGGWSRLTPEKPLASGEYALVQAPARQDLIAHVVYDFSFDPTAPNGSDIVQPSPPAQ